ncbi:MAG: hypothetical protein KIG68_09625 [Oxalobacter sp.]|nr:hypothetical protein [Oxalobacter sp.]
MKKTLSALTIALLAVSLTGCGGGKKEAPKASAVVAQTSQQTQKVAGLGISTKEFKERYDRFTWDLGTANPDVAVALSFTDSIDSKINKDTHVASICASNKLCALIKTADDNESIIDVGTIAQGDGTPQSGATAFLFMSCVAGAAIPEVKNVKEVGPTIMNLVKSAKGGKQAKAMLKGYELTLLMSKEIGVMMSISKK